MTKREIHFVKILKVYRLAFQAYHFLLTPSRLRHINPSLAEYHNRELSEHANIWVWEGRISKQIESNALKLCLRIIEQARKLHKIMWARGLESPNVDREKSIILLLNQSRLGLLEGRRCEQSVFVNLRQQDFKWCVKFSYFCLLLALARM